VRGTNSAMRPKCTKCTGAGRRRSIGDRRLYGSPARARARRCRISLIRRPAVGECNSPSSPLESDPGPILASCARPCGSAPTGGVPLTWPARRRRGLDPIPHRPQTERRKNNFRRCAQKIKISSDRRLQIHASASAFQRSHNPHPYRTATD
jgi:hypothetical protein